MNKLYFFSSFFVGALFLLLSFKPRAQADFTLSNVLDSIERNNPISKMYDADIRSMDEAAKGAKSWMPPEVGTGFFMTPYNTKKWKSMSEMDRGMGSFMISVQQMIPNRKKLNAEAAYMKSMSGPTIEQRQTALNDLFAQAKKAYYDWILIEKKKTVVADNETVLEFMINNAEIRYRNGLEKVNAYYKAKAALGNLKGMQIMLDNEALQKRILLNTLMNRSPGLQFNIDTTIRFKDFDAYVFDSTQFINTRSDLKAIDREGLTNQLRMQSERQNLKPQFGLRYEHMFAFGSQPQQFTLMGMMRLPLVPWASRMSKANVESYKWRAEALNSQRQMILNEARGMANGMRSEIENKKRQVGLYETNIIPALRNNYKTMLLAYEQNTQELFMLFDAWETLNMTQLEYFDQLQQVLTLQVELERIIQLR